MKLATVLIVIMGLVASSSAATQPGPHEVLAHHAAKLQKVVEDQLKDPNSVVHKVLDAVKKALSDWEALPQAEKDKVLAQISQVAKDAWTWLVKQAEVLAKQLADVNSPLRKLLDAIVAKVLEWLKSPAAKKIYEGVKGAVENFLKSPLGKHLLEEGTKLLTKGLEFLKGPAGQKLIADATKAISVLTAKVVPVVVKVD